MILHYVHYTSFINGNLTYFLSFVEYKNLKIDILNYFHTTKFFECDGYVRMLYLLVKFVLIVDKFRLKDGEKKNFG